MTELDLCYLSATEAIAAFRNRLLSPLELMTALITRAEAVEPTINALPMTYFDRAVDQARKAEARYMKTDGRLRALEGIPVAIKDETAIKGEVTTYGSLIYKGHRDAADAPVVERLKRAGAIIHARTSAPEFGCATFTHSRLWGVTRNPWNPDYTPGGSSGGAGASLAAGTTMLADGTDSGGSIRIPASACGVVGFKPSYGRVPLSAPFNLDFCSHAGPIARTVGDCRLFQNVIAGPHPKDIASLRPKLRIPEKLGGIERWRIAVSMDLGYFEVDPEVIRNTEAALDVFRGLGATVEPVDLAWTSETATAAEHYLTHIFGSYLVEEFQDHRLELTDYARAYAETARETSPARFLSSLEQAGRMYETLGPVLERYHVLICPTLAVPSVKADLDPCKDVVRINGVAVDPMSGWCMTYPFNMLSRCPVLSVPSGFAANGVPTGVQIVGRTYDDIRVFQAAAAYERAAPVLDWKSKRPSL